MIFTGLQVTPEAARKYPWLEPLARAYEAIDKSIRADLSARATAGQPQPVCAKGCGVCCLAPVLNVTPIEMQGLSWYVSEVLAGPQRECVKDQLRNHRDSPACPFLVNSECAVYAARPLTCRHLYVLNKVCTPEEHIEKTRPRDVLVLGANGGHEAATILLQSMTGESEAVCKQAVKRGAFGKTSKLMHTMALERLVEVMEFFDR